MGLAGIQVPPGMVLSSEDAQWSFSLGSYPGLMQRLVSGYAPVKVGRSLN